MTTRAAADLAPRPSMLGQVRRSMGGRVAVCVDVTFGSRWRLVGTSGRNDYGWRGTADVETWAVVGNVLTDLPHGPGGGGA